ncbi:MAG: polysaccharide deacetylase family protein [bacterium]
MLRGPRMRALVKRALAGTGPRRAASGITILTYHRVGGGSLDERDLDSAAFAAQLEVLGRADVISLDEASERLASGDRRSGVVLTFDDGFADVYDNAWPLLRGRRLPFTLFLATRYVGGRMRWEGSTAKADGAALTWDQIGELTCSGLCTVGNHTHSHVPPDRLSTGELDACSAAVERRLGVRPRHFAYPWGVPVAGLEGELRRRFRTAATGVVGRNLPGVDPMRLRRVPVRRTDPPEFFAAKLSGRLVPERAYGALVATAKKAGARA